MAGRRLKKKQTTLRPPIWKSAKDWNTGRAQGGCRFHIGPLTESGYAPGGWISQYCSAQKSRPRHPPRPLNTRPQPPTCPAPRRQLPDGHSHDGDGVGQAAMLPAQRQHLGIASAPRGAARGPAQLGDGAAQPGPLQLLHPGGWKVSSERVQRRRMGRELGSPLPSSPPLPFCFWGSLGHPVQSAAPQQR